MLRLSRRSLLRGSGAFAATKLFAPSIIKPASAGFALGKAGGGGGGDYVAKAVSFDGGTVIKLTDQAVGLAANSPTGLWACWVKGNDIFNSSSNPAFAYSLGSDAFDIKNALGVQNGIGTDWASSPDYVDAFGSNNNSNPIPGDRWVLLMYSWDMNHAPGSRVIQLYYEDEAQTSTIEYDDGAAFSIDYSDTGWVFFGPFDNDAAIKCDAADFQLWLGGDFVDLSVEANRRAIISASGKPVDPAVAAARFGSQKILFSGDASTFATNGGSGGATSMLIGTITNATTSPSD